MREKIATLILATERLSKQPLWVRMSQGNKIDGTAAAPQ
jgi:hypothetical protein